MRYGKHPPLLKAFKRKAAVNERCVQEAGRTGGGGGGVAECGRSPSDSEQRRLVPAAPATGRQEGGGARRRCRRCLSHVRDSSNASPRWNQSGCLFPILRERDQLRTLNKTFGCTIFPSDFLFTWRTTKQSSLIYSRLQSFQCDKCISDPGGG